MMNWLSQLPTALVGTAFVVAQPQLVLALNSVQIANLAEKITVLINGQNPGSGVIIGKTQNTYYVLTAKHVVGTPDEYEIVTSDKRRYPLVYSRVRKFAGIDLAVVQFSSDRDYQVATLGDSEAATTGSPIYIYGFPNPGREITRRIPLLTDGQIAGRPDSPLRDGYDLIYTNVTRAGMSGGPVLNGLGQVVGIHGRAEAEATTGFDLANNQSGFAGGDKVGLNLGIPINTFKRLANQAGIGFSASETPPPTLLVSGYLPP